MRFLLPRGRTAVPCLARPALALLSLCAGPALAQATGWEAGAVLDLSASSRPLALGQRDKGLALGHSDLGASGPLGRHFFGTVSAAIATHDRKFEGELEEAWVETRTWPAGLQLRAGRFASQLGYLNEQHPHADDFVERPLLYRAFFGGHWNDDGVRLNWTAPTDLYLRLGAEAFRGRQLVREAASSRRAGAVVLSARAGGDVGTSHSWQAGLAKIRNRREAAVEAHDEEEEGGEHQAHEHHGHGAAFTGGRGWVGELTWKWAPGGNNRAQQLRVTYEIAQWRDLNRFAAGSDRHRASYLSVAWRFSPQWEAGVRTDRLRVRMPHEDHFDDGRLRETAVMLAWKPSHAQTLRVQATRQRSGAGFDAARNALQLQYVLGFGAHAAHSF